MAASRDDFIIAIRSAFLKKATKQRFSLFALVSFSIALIVLSNLNFSVINYLYSGINEVVYRISFVASVPEKKIHDLSININEHMNLYKNYKEKEKKLKEIIVKNYNIEFLISENKRLKELINEYVYDTDELAAKVLIDKNSPFLKSIILNRGSKDNIKIGDAVLDGSYLVGKIVEVNFKSSRALLISDLNSKIPVTIMPGNVQSILTGTGKTQGEIQYQMEEKDIEDNSIVYTSGSGGIFKSGIPIGKITEVSNINGIKVKFFSNLSQLNFVKVVSFNRGDN